MPLPNPGMDFSPFATLPASSLDDLVENIEALATGSALAVSSVTPEKLLTGTGTAWTWTSYTPTRTAITVGNGTEVSKYKQIGKNVEVRYILTLGTTSAIGTGPSITLPVTAASDYPLVSVGVGLVTCYDNGGANNTGFVRLESTTLVQAFLNNAGATYTNLNQITASAPHVWGSTDVFAMTFSYEAA